MKTRATLQSHATGRSAVNHRPQLGRRLAVSVILFSTAIAIVTTFIQLAFDYRDNVKQIEASLENIRYEHLPSLTLSLWETDIDQLTVQLHGLASSPTIEHIQVETEDGIVAAAGEAKSTHIVRRTYDLVYEYRHENLKIGTIQIDASIDDIINRLLQKALVVLTTNAVKTFLVAGFMLYLFQKIIGRHLQRLADYARERQDSEHLELLQLDRDEAQAGRGDELDYVVSAINDYVREVHHRQAERAASERELRTAVETMEEAVRQARIASRAKDEFLANMSHELRTPLNSIIGFSEMLTTERQAGITPERRAEYAKFINASGRHLLSVISDILEISKIEHGKIVLSETAVPLAAALAEAVDMVKPRIEVAQLDLEVRHSAPNLVLLADQTRLKQMVLNLLTNAVKFTKPGGRITIDTGCNDAGEIVISIADTGIGIAAKDMPAAMEPFGQIRSGYQQTHEGTGLGLPLVRRLVESHGGRLELTSEPGIGTTARLTFPAFRTRPAANRG